MSQELLTIVRSPHSPALPLSPSSKLLFINTPRGPLFILRLFSPPSSRLDLWLKIQNSPEIYTQCSVPEFVTRTAHYIRRIFWIQAWIFASLMQGSGLVPQERRWLRPIFEMPWNLSSNGCISCVDSSSFTSLPSALLKITKEQRPQVFSSEKQMNQLDLDSAKDKTVT